MERIDDLLRRAGGQEQTTYTAAQVLDACNRALRVVVGADDADARATSVRDGTVTIQVRHSAIAGRIRIARADILTSANEALGRRWPEASRPRRIVTRVT